jgi:uncharacterized metal-binding protein
MSEKTGCACDITPKLIFPCSGAADVGEIADRAGRKLSAGGAGKMSCLAGLGGHASGIVESARAASGILAIDGCPVDCAKNTLEMAGFSGFAHLRVTDLGMKKGQSPATDENIASVVAAAKSALA